MNRPLPDTLKTVKPYKMATLKLNIEVMYKADSCLPCFYMDEAVKEVVPCYSDLLEYHRVDIKTPSGKKRFIELSIFLFGEDGVYRHQRIAPIPSLFINEELYFDTIPPRYELEAAIHEMVEQKGLDRKADQRYQERKAKREYRPHLHGG